MRDVMIIAGGALLFYVLLQQLNKRDAVPNAYSYAAGEGPYTGLDYNARDVVSSVYWE